MQNYSSKFKNDIRQRAYRYALSIIKFLEGMTRTQTSLMISNQLLRSATSVGANIIEAQASATKKDFANFLNHALKSANESKFWLGLLRDSGQVESAQVNVLLQETAEISNILGSSILTIRGKRAL